ncbi:MAG TPA: hypothetical protein VNH46_04285 [Gemmatimonadales bacterium]|nr:hypothetical protein [Gemmatimonadales bacterium]
MRALGLGAGLLFLAAAPTAAEIPAISYPESLRAEWSVAPTPAGRGHVVGYLYNRNLNDAANVWLRVDRVAADGSVTATYRGRVVGDVLAGGRSLFDVPVPDPGAAYRVSVEAVDWVKECR